MADENSYDSSSSKSGGSSVYRIVVWILTLLLVLCILAGVAYFVVYLMRRSNGMYVTYDGTYISASNDGIYIDFSDDHSFYIKNDSWGSYSVELCSVSVENNVASGSRYDFSCSVNGEDFMFSDVKDFTSCFSASGAIEVSSDGSFSVIPQSKFERVSDVLNCLYGTSVTCSDDYLVSSYPFFKLCVTSPDESSVIDIPFSFRCVDVYVSDVSMSDVHLYF